MVALINAPSLVCSSCDEYLLQFVVLSGIRGLLRRPTIGISISPERCLNKKGFPNLLKRYLFLVCKVIPKVYVLSILPFDVEPRLGQLVSNWIYDPQFWDLGYLNINDKSRLPKEIVKLRQVSGERAIVVSLGKQDIIKGAAYFVHLYNSSEILRNAALFVMVGNCSLIESSDLDKFRSLGGVVVDRFVTEEELIACYEIADCVWACYDPDYNQSSGIFGRAIQIGVPVIVRKGSYLEEIHRKLTDKDPIVLEYKQLTIDADILEHYARNIHMLPRPKSPSKKEGIQRFVSLIDRYSNGHNDLRQE
jgi:hypothetical protein